MLILVFHFFNQAETSHFVSDQYCQYFFCLVKGVLYRSNLAEIFFLCVIFPGGSMSPPLASGVYDYLLRDAILWRARLVLRELGT